MLRRQTQLVGIVFYAAFRLVRLHQRLIKAFEDILFPAFILHGSSIGRRVISEDITKLIKEPLHQAHYHFFTI